MKKKKLLSVLLAGVMAVTLTACGSGSASTEGSASDTNNTSTSSASTVSTASGSTSSSAEETPVDGGQLIIVSLMVISTHIGQIIRQIMQYTG